MVNELNFTIFKSSLIELLKGLCEHDNSFVEIWQIVCTHKQKMWSSSPLSKMRVSLKRLIKLLVRRKVSVDLERSNKSFGCRTKTENSRVDPSSSFDLESLGGYKIHQGERYRHLPIDEEYFLYKGRVCIPIVGDFP